MRAVCELIVELARMVSDCPGTPMPHCTKTSELLPEPPSPMATRLARPLTAAVMPSLKSWVIAMMGKSSLSLMRAICSAPGCFPELDRIKSSAPVHTHC